MNSNWPGWKKMTFIFFSVFLCFNCFPFSQLLALLFKHLIDPVAKNILGIGYEFSYQGTGSGDMTINYVELFISFCLTLVITPALFFALNKKANFDKLHYWFRVYMRYYLANIMFAYGIAKVLKMQFTDPNLDTLMTTYGNSSPMGLAWRFMGYSDMYRNFTGYVEIIAGILLLFRKTTLFGALFSFSIMFNVVMVNFGFDVPVKLFSTQLAIVSLYIIAPDLTRLIRFFFLDKEVTATQIYQPVLNRDMRRARLIIKPLFIILLFGIPLLQYLNYDQGPAKPPLYGIYHITKFSKNREVMIPLITDTICWKTLVVSRSGNASIRMCNDSIKRIGFRPDTLKNLIDVSDHSRTYQFTYKNLGDKLNIEGPFQGDSIKVEMKRYDEKNFRLVKRGFHWINEFPYNR
jgi:hypothetical protein